MTRFRSIIISQRKLEEFAREVSHLDQYDFEDMLEDLSPFEMDALIRALHEELQKPERSAEASFAQGLSFHQNKRVR